MKEDKEFWDWWNSLSDQEKEQEIGKRKITRSTLVRLNMAITVMVKKKRKNVRPAIADGLA